MFFCWLGSGLKLSQGRFRLDISKSFFTQGVVAHWNRFSQGSVTAASLAEFRKHLENSLRYMMWFWVCAVPGWWLNLDDPCESLQTQDIIWFYAILYPHLWKQFRIVLTCTVWLKLTDLLKLTFPLFLISVCMNGYWGYSKQDSPPYISTLSFQRRNCDHWDSLGNSCSSKAVITLCYMV